MDVKNLAEEAIGSFESFKQCTLLLADITRGERVTNRGIVNKVLSQTQEIRNCMFILQNHIFSSKELALELGMLISAAPLQKFEVTREMQEDQDTFDSSRDLLRMLRTEDKFLPCYEKFVSLTEEAQSLCLGVIIEQRLLPYIAVVIENALENAVVGITNTPGTPIV